MGNYKVLQKDGYMIIYLKGRMDAVHSFDLKEMIKELVSKGHYKIIFDLKETEFIDSAFLGVVVSAQRMVSKKDGSISFVKGNERIMRIIKQTRFDVIFKFYNSIEEGIRG